MAARRARRPKHGARHPIGEVRGRRSSDDPRHFSGLTLLGTKIASGRVRIDPQGMRRTAARAEKPPHRPERSVEAMTAVKAYIQDEESEREGVSRSQSSIFATNVLFLLCHDDPGLDRRDGKGWQHGQRMRVRASAIVELPSDRRDRTFDMSFGSDWRRLWVWTQG